MFLCPAGLCSVPTSHITMLFSGIISFRSIASVNYTPMTQQEKFWDETSLPTKLPNITSNFLPDSSMWQSSNTKCTKSKPEHLSLFFSHSYYLPNCSNLETYLSTLASLSLLDIIVLVSLCTNSLVQAITSFLGHWQTATLSTTLSDAFCKFNLKI